MTYAVLTWTLPPTRADGAPLKGEDIDHIDIYDSLSIPPHVPVATVPGGVNTFTTGELSNGDHMFTLVATDKDGLRSAHTNVAVASAPVAKAIPNAPSALSAVVYDEPAPKAGDKIQPKGSPAAPLFSPAPKADAT